MTKKQKKTLYRIIVAAFLLVLCICLPLKGWLRLAVFMLRYVIIGYDILKKAIIGICNKEIFDENFLMAGLMTKSLVESKPMFCLHGDALSVWIDNGKITFGSEKQQFGVKDIICKELYEQGFHPQKDMTSTKIVALAVLYVCPPKLILYKGLSNKGIEEFLKQYIGVFGEIDIELIDKDIPDFVGGSVNA